MPSTRLAIRLALHGCTNRPFYHIVVTNKRRARNVTPIEQLGTYDPLVNKFGEKLCAINFDRLNYWLGMRAEPTQPVLELLGMAGYFPIYPMTYIKAKRKAKHDEEAKLKEQSVTEIQESETAESSSHTLAN